MDFSVEHTIHAAPEDVARIMLDPDREGEWMSKGAKAERLTPGPLEVGSRVRHEAGIGRYPSSLRSRRSILAIA